MKKILIVLLFFATLISPVLADTDENGYLINNSGVNAKAPDNVPTPTVEFIKSVWDDSIMDYFMIYHFKYTNRGLKFQATDELADHNPFISNEAKYYVFLFHGQTGTYWCKPFFAYEDGLYNVGEVEFFADGGLAIVKKDYGKAKMGKAVGYGSIADVNYPSREDWDESPKVVLDVGESRHGNCGDATLLSFGHFQPNEKVTNDFFKTKIGSITNHVKFDVIKREYEGVVYDDYKNYHYTSIPIRLNWYDFDSVSFDDMANHWSNNSVNKCYQLGLINGVGDNKFAPDQALTRAHVVQMLYNFAKKYNYDSNYVKQNISDVGDNAWYSEAFNWAVDKGIVKTESSKVSPNQLATRLWSCVTIADFIKKCDMALPYWDLGKDFRDMSQDYYTRCKPLEQYKDAVPKIKILQKAEIISGIGNNNFGPENNLTRGQAARILESLAYAVHMMEDGEWTNQFECPDYYQMYKDLLCDTMGF